jgi:uncharacterized protein YcnI
MNIRTLGLAASLCLTATTAFGHASLEVKEAAINANYKAVMRISHGCEGSATKRVRIQIPEGVISVKPMPKAGWDLTTVRSEYAKTYEYHGPKSEGVTEIIWTGILDDQHFDEFTFRGRITDVFKTGQTIHFPTIQECETGENAWVEIRTEGEDAPKLKRPAPGLKLLGMDHSGH